MKIQKQVKRFMKRFFQVKRIIVVTDDAVEYYPLNRTAQLLVFFGILGAVAWGSYSTGSFMSAQHQLAQKDRTIQEVNLENKKIESQFSLLKRDLVKMHSGEDKKELSEYTRFIIKQYSGDNMAGIKNLAYNNISTKGEQGMVMERINFLEQRVEQLKQEKHEMVSAVRRETNDKIKELNTVIGLTGLNSETLANNQRREDSVEAGRTHAALDVADEEEVADAGTQGTDGVEAASADAASEEVGQGGPLVPYQPINIEKKEKELFSGIKRMMTLYDVVNTLPLNKPLYSGRITSGFGRRVDPFTHQLASHLGLDFSGPSGTRVLATNDGTVDFTGAKNAYGNMIEIDHGLGITTRYGHLSAFLVKQGQHVRKGQVIGIQGSTGRSTGNHVHYEVRYHDEPLNPIKFIKAGDYVSAID